MGLSEFDLIQRFFTRPALHSSINRLTVGDDAAIMQIPEGQELVITVDTMVCGVHFFPDVDAESLGHKLLAVNLSDLAAMGAKPVAATLALTLPKVDADWLAGFAKGWWHLADQFGVDLIGGDTTAGPLTLSLQLMGLVKKETALKRSGARPGDGIYVTGTLGDAGLGLKILQNQWLANKGAVLDRFHQPWPRVKEGMSLIGIASACIDLSDGLASDLRHILEQSQVGARVDLDGLPVSEAVFDYMAKTGDAHLPLSAGEDYELCFTVPEQWRQKIPIPCTRIGVIESEPGLRMCKNGITQALEVKGYEHFS